MWHCPVCNNSINANFGMVQCSQCQTVLFVDFNGNVIIGGGDDSVSDENNDAKEQTNVKDIELEKSEYAEVVSAEEVPVESEQPMASENFWAPSAQESTPESSFQDQNVGEQSLPEPTFDDSFQPEAFQNVTPQEATAFASSEGRNGGTAFYQITIEGIDASSLRRAVLDSLRDSRLGLVNDEISGNIEQGRLLIKALNPVKASFIMNALKDLPLEINWEMYAPDTNSDS